MRLFFFWMLFDGRLMMHCFVLQTPEVLKHFTFILMSWIDSTYVYMFGRFPCSLHLYGFRCNTVTLIANSNVISLYWFPSFDYWHLLGLVAPVCTHVQQISGLTSVFTVLIVSLSLYSRFCSVVWVAQWANGHTASSQHREDLLCSCTKWWGQRKA